MRPLGVLPAPLLALVIAASNLALSSALDNPGWPEGFIVEHTEPIFCSRPTRNNDRIAVHYRGTLQTTGVEFDESYKRGSPFLFNLGAGQVIRGWDLGLVDMCPGEKRKLIIPPELGYGSRGSGPIPPDSTLVFETELVDIVGIEQEDFFTATPSTSAVVSTSEPIYTIATAPPEPPQEQDGGADTKGQQEDNQEQDKDKASSPPLEGLPDDDSTPLPPPVHKEAECRLLGPYALIVQLALGGVALLTLVWKRYHETPKRPWKIFIFDVSKQVFGSMLTHVLNVGMSMIASVDLINQAKKAAESGEANDERGHSPNPCSFYLLNLGIDTTLGIPVLWLALKVLHILFLRTSLARPAESIKSGNYGSPPRWQWWMKQSLIYFIALVIMKIFVFFLFSALPWLPWVGDWALRWTKGNEKLEVAFAMFIFPLGMNAIQYWVIDNFIMDKKKDGEGYEQVHQGDDEDATLRDESLTEVEEEEALVKGDDGEEQVPLKEAHPMPITEHDDAELRAREPTSRSHTPKVEDTDGNR